MSLKQMWRRGWKTKAFMLIFALMVPMTILGSIFTYLVAEYLFNPHLRVHPAVELKPEMFRALSIGTLDSTRVLTVARAIQDSLLRVESSAGNIPEGLDFIVLRTYYVPSLGKGAVLADIFLSCGCPEDAGKLRLVEAMIFPDSSTYKIITDLVLPWDYYLNPWSVFLDQPTEPEQGALP